MLVVQAADASGQGQEPVGEGEHEQRDGWKQQGGRGGGHLHGRLPVDRVRVCFDVQRVDIGNRPPAG